MKSAKIVLIATFILELEFELALPFVVVRCFIMFISVRNAKNNAKTAEIKVFFDVK